MIDERQLIEIAVSDVPERDPDAKERARSILQAQIRETLAVPGRRRSPRARWLVAAALVATAVLAIRAILPGHESAAAKELHRLASIDAARPTPDISGGRYLYTSSESMGVQRAGSVDGPSIDLVLQGDIEVWRRSDGSGLMIQTVRSVRFETPADRAAWEAAGKPELSKPGIETTKYQPGDLLDLSTLPTDPVELEAQLRDGLLLDHQGDPAALGKSIGELLIQGGASPALRGALFQIMADLPNVRLIESKIDNLGREGIGLLFTDGAHEFTYVFDPATAKLLEYELLLHLNGETTTLSWQDPTATAVVDAAGERP